MRTTYFTITAIDVQVYAEMRLQKYLRLKDHGPKCRAMRLWTVLLYAAARICSLAAACASLANAPSDTAVHDALLAGLPAYAELQRRLNRALQGDLPHTLRRHRQPLAIDLTLIPYHGQPMKHPDEIYRSQAKSGTTHFHAYATAYVVRTGLRFTVGLTGAPLLCSSVEFGNPTWHVSFVHELNNGGHPISRSPFSCLHGAGLGTTGFRGPGSVRG